MNKFLLAGHKFMLRLFLRQSRFTYSACGPLTKHREKIQKIRETGDLKHLYRNQSKLVLLMMILRILIVKIKPAELFLAIL